MLHLTIILGAFAIAAVGTPVGALAMLVAVKTTLDLRGTGKNTIGHDEFSRQPRRSELDTHLQSMELTFTTFSSRPIMLVGRV